MWIEGDGRIGIVKLVGHSENLSAQQVVDADFVGHKSFGTDANMNLS
jgi:hypothetical protein